MNNSKPITINESSWHSLKKYTNARIAIGRCGNSIPTKELLAFKLAHAKAIDAVNVPFQTNEIISDIELITGKSTLQLQSKACNRAEYLQRPDLGRTLSESSIECVKSFPKSEKYDISLVVADGLSSLAIEKNIIPLLQLLLPELKKRDYSLAPICIVEQGRVAISDSIGEHLNAQLAIIFIGERPGLMSPDSMGIYLTYNPKSGNTDERRNCISNVRIDGLSYAAACSKLLYLINESFTRKLSGVNLKDEQDIYILAPETTLSLD